MNNFFVVANAGRSCSTYLAHLIRSADTDDVYVAHEDIPVQIARPRLYNHAYCAGRQRFILSDVKLKPYLDRWLSINERKRVIETGWTAYHLLPLLYRLFDERLRVVVLHRQPWRVALSRANMGNYHPATWYDDAHEVSPFDPHTIAPQFNATWGQMNHVEKCLYWWFVCYKEIAEFIEKYPAVSSISISADELSTAAGRERLFRFFSIRQPDAHTLKGAPRNLVRQFMRETFPVGGEWRGLLRHDEIATFARDAFGYTFDPAEIERQAAEYALPAGILPWLRHRAGFWATKRQAGRWTAPLRSRSCS